ncbi:helix-turn-helix transcriptional regulator [Cronobacter muytjensii]|uniref:helix-turn-helix domain-containing protein n=1 Tax=Cronobacter muytjensii TaxID=413501 RepID=UPI002DBB50FD|nr:helix-turn-helix transcriptional regulator [Cronobacter muytjensii]MEB8638623.1 helix-turn-helix transcriptional regulator [Cronobacter muytjensii]
MNKIDNNISDNPVIQRLEELMRVKHISKADMARIVNVSRSSVNGWFKRGSISKDAASKLAAHTGVSIAWLLGELDSLEENSPDEKQLVEVYRRLPPIERRNMLAAFEMRLAELKDYYSKYAVREADKGND